MKPPNGIRITPEELAAIVAARRPERPRDDPPQSQDFPLALESRLWYVAEFIHQARLARREGRADLELSWRERAQEIAAELASIFVHAPATDKGKEVAPELLRAVADALEGRHRDPAPEDDQRRVLSAINSSLATIGRAPSNKELRELHISGRAIDEVLSNIRNANDGKGIKLHPERHGRKPKK